MPRLIGPGLVAVLTAAALLVSGSQALASHVQCGDVITQDTKLDSDLIGCPGDGIVIGASDITLDLDGHTVKGNAIGSGIANEYDRVTVRDGTVTGPTGLLRRRGHRQCDRLRTAAASHPGHPWSRHLVV